MFLLDFPYDKEYYKHHSFLLIARGYDWSKNWMFSAHIYQVYLARKDELDNKYNYEGWKMYIELMKHHYKYYN
jgi:hypothetical protein